MQPCDNRNCDTHATTTVYPTAHHHNQDTCTLPDWLWTCDDHRDWAIHYFTLTGHDVRIRSLTPLADGTTR